MSVRACFVSVGNTAALVLGQRIWHWDSIRKIDLEERCIVFEDAEGEQLSDEEAEALDILFTP